MELVRLHDRSRLCRRGCRPGKASKMAAYGGRHVGMAPKTSSKPAILCFGQSLFFAMIEDGSAFNTRPGRSRGDKHCSRLVNRLDKQFCAMLRAIEAEDRVTFVNRPSELCSHVFQYVTANPIFGHIICILTSSEVYRPDSAYDALFIPTSCPSYVSYIQLI